MPERRLEFWFEFASPYSYLAAMRIEDLAAKQSVTIDWRPFLLGAIFKKDLGYADSPFNRHQKKGEYLWQDMKRQSRLRDLPPPVKPSPFPQNAILAARIATALLGDEGMPAFVRAIYQNHFQLGRNVDDKAMIIETLDGLDLDSDAILTKANETETKVKLKELTSLADEIGIFGAPTMRTQDGELFWGMIDWRWPLHGKQGRCQRTFSSFLVQMWVWAGNVEEKSGAIAQGRGQTMRPKLTDVARHAGVSLATADRVLNKRAGVSEKTRRKVQAAIDQLGYERHPVATSLATVEKKRIAVVLPKMAIGFHAAIERHWDRLKTIALYESVRLDYHCYAPELVSNCVDCMIEASKTTDGVILCGHDLPEVHDATKSLADKGVVTHTFLSDLTSGFANCYVGFDHIKVGRTMSYFMMLLTNAKPGVIYNHPCFNDTLAFQQRLRSQTDYIEEKNWPVELITPPIEQVCSKCDTYVSSLLEQGSELVGVICYNDICLHSLGEVIKAHNTAASDIKVIVVAMEISPGLAQALINDRIHAIFYLDAVQAMECAIARLNADIEAKKAGLFEGANAKEFLDAKIYVKENLPDWCREAAE